MNVLVTAGNTQTPLDRVRCITNIFTGRTGAQIASEAFNRGHRVTLLTSHPDVLDAIICGRPRTGIDWQLRSYRTFDDLERLMKEEVSSGRYDAVVHSAAVSDYRVAGVYTHQDGAFADVAAGKIKSQHQELWLKLTPTPKLVDQVRTEWGFRGILVKFKLEVGVTDEELLEIAERSRLQSRADLMSANTLESMHAWAFLGAGPNYRRIARGGLAAELVGEVERVHGTASPGT
jgi:phosphopantothenate-cysteine ligase/phosphopantothenoylcysteine decarboxylase/phosphopantothenate--cysteine ligase